MSIEVDGSKGIQQNTTEVTKIPVGTTAQRPANPEAGMIRFNTDTGQVEGYNDVAETWQSLGDYFQQVVATGGTVTDIIDGGVNYRVHTFTSSGTFEVTAGSGEVEYLVVAGGGGGSSSNFGGGGGAGGYRASVSGESSGGGVDAESPISLSEGVYTVTIGDGGAVENNGQNSVFHTITSLGGGFGVTRTTAGDGGSGGACADLRSGGIPGSGTSGQGFDGENGDIENGVGTGGGGGGGAGGLGTEGTATQGGDGGPGVSSQIDGTSTARAGGGAGASNTGNNGTGGLGGGGAGNGQNGANNTGGGGGANGGNGGSGIVIVRYRIG